MEANQLKFMLQAMHFSADLPPEVVEQLASESVLRRVSAGTVVFREGSKNDNLYLVHSGRVALEMNFPGRGAVRILTLGAGDMVGWSSLIDHGKMTASAVAVEDSDLVVAPAIKLKQLSETNHNFGFHLMRQMAGALAKRLVATRLQLLDLFADAPPKVPNGTSEREG